MLPPTQSNTLPLGHIIADTYRVEEHIGAGGMGNVYHATHLATAQPVAIKVLSRRDATPETIARFEREAHAAQQLHHVNTVRIFDAGRDEGTLFIAMELLYGQPLSQTLQHGPIDSVYVCHILGQILESLREAHARGIIHRDITPHNIFLCHHEHDPNFVKVLDFGLAKVTSLPPNATPPPTITLSGSLLGTPAYMSPEQARSDQLDPRSDLYSCGVLAFEMLTGSVPFLAHDLMGTLLRHCTDPIPPIQAPNTPKALRDWVRKALSKHPEERFSCADHMLQALRQINLHATPTAINPFHIASPDDLALDLSQERHEAPSLPSNLPKTLVFAALFVVFVAGAVFGLHTLSTSPASLTPHTSPHDIQHPSSASLSASAHTPSVTVEASKPEKNQVNITVQSTPPGAEVFLGEELLGTSPVTIQRPQNAKQALALTLRKDGFQPFTSTLSLREDSSLQATLQPRTQPVASPNRPRKNNRPRISQPSRGFANPYN